MSQVNDAAAGHYGDRPGWPRGAVPFIHIQGVSKRFGDFVAVDNVDLEIYKGELFALLGGSGCGKTTLLRMLAGFEEPSSGNIFIDGADMRSVPPYERPVNMMFQSYALFPHMRVEQNVAYGLKRDGVPPRRDQAARRRDAGDGRAGGLRQAQAASAFRRAAPARRAGEGAGQAAEGAAARRAAGGAGQAPARADAVRADEHPGQARRHLHRRHPRPGGGDDPVDADRG